MNGIEGRVGLGDNTAGSTLQTPIVHLCYLFDISAVPYSQLRQEFCVEGLQLVHRGLLRRPADDETLSIARCGLGNDVEVNVEDMLERNFSIVLKETIRSERTRRRL